LVVAHSELALPALAVTNPSGDGAGNDQQPTDHAEIDELPEIQNGRPVAQTAEIVILLHAVKVPLISRADRAPSNPRLGAWR
jgi:hypothetical protein